MEVKEIKDALESIKTQVADATGKNKEFLDGEIKSIGQKLEDFQKSVDQSVKDATTASEELRTKLKEELQAEIKAVQEHADKIDVKMQGKSKEQGKEGVSFEVEMKSVLTDNFEDISTVRSGKSAKIEVKAVGDMTLANNLTGDQPRTYSQNVIAVPSPIINFSDLIGAPINIEGGTYTFPKETGSEGSISTQTEGSAKSQIDYDITMEDVTTDFLSGTTTYSKKMSNNLPFLVSFIPTALRRDYIKAENKKFNTVLEAGALASTQVITGKNKVEMLINEIATLEQLDNPVNGIVVRPSDWWDVQKTEKSVGAGYGLPGVVVYENGRLMINGIPLYKATWVTTNKYFVGDWTRIRKIVTEGLSLEFSNENKDNFEKNNITARIEAQIGLAIERDNAIIFGDFTAV